MSEEIPKPILNAVGQVRFDSLMSMLIDICKNELNVNEAQMPAYLPTIYEAARSILIIEQVCAENSEKVIAKLKGFVMVQGILQTSISRQATVCPKCWQTYCKCQ